MALPAFAQETCPRPSDVGDNALATPDVTAADNDLMGFARAEKQYLASVRPGSELAFSACLLRNEEAWKSGSAYIVTMSPDGRVFFHSNDAALSGRQLQPSVWRAIAGATGAAGLLTTGDFGKGIIYGSAHGTQVASSRGKPLGDCRSV